VRESFAAEGHEGATGRLDLKIRLGAAATIAVEVKLGEAERADTGKGAGYCRSVKADQYILLVTEANDEDYCGFRPRRWVDVCLQLRLLARRFLNMSAHLKAGKVLAFAAAVEQNLLKFQPDIPHVGGELAAAPILPQITDPPHSSLQLS
jgi:hypothetical protein